MERSGVVEMLVACGGWGWAREMSRRPHDGLRKDNIEVLVCKCVGGVCACVESMHVPGCALVCEQGCVSILVHVSSWLWVEGVCMCLACVGAHLGLQVGMWYVGSVAHVCWLCRGHNSISIQAGPRALAGWQWRAAGGWASGSTLFACRPHMYLR